MMLFLWMQLHDHIHASTYSPDGFAANGHSPRVLNDLYLSTEHLDEARDGVVHELSSVRGEVSKMYKITPNISNIEFGDFSQW